MSTPSGSSPPMADFFLNGGATGALIRAFDWSKTPLGPIENWPQSLKTATTLLLNSPVPIVMLWGEDGIMIYNDAYSVFAGGRHPQLLGSKVREGWDEIADFNDNVMKVGLAGGTLAYRDQELTLYRRGRPEQVWMNLDYSPVIDESGQPAGVLAIVIETTERVLAERARQEAEATTRASEARLRDVLDNMTEAFVLLDRDFRIVDINDEGLRLEGRRREDIVGKTQWAAWPGTEETVVGDLYRRAMAERVPVETEYHYVWPDGHSAWVDLRAFPTRDGLAIFYRDISERKAEEDALRDSNARLRTLVEQAAAGICQADLEGRIVLVNDRFCQILGRSEEDLLGQPLLDLTHPEDVPAKAAALARLMDTGEPFFIEKRYVRPDGSSVWVSNHVSLARDDGGRPRYASVVVLDITERKQVEGALREGEERLRVAQAAGGIGTFELLPDAGRIVVSEEFCRLWGVPPVNEIDTAYFLALIHPDDREAVRTGQRRLSENALEYVEYRIIRPDTGEVRWMARQGEAVVDDATGGVRFFGVSYDITERRHAEEELREGSRTLETLNGTGQALAAELDLNRLVQKITDAGVDLTGAAFGAFFYNVLDAKGESYMLYTLSGAERAQFEAFGMPRATAVFQPTFKGEGVLRSDDILQDPRYGHNPPHRGMPEGHLPVRSYLAVPVTSRSGEVVGGLFFGHPEPRRFTERHEQLMVGVAGQAAIAIDNARLYQSAQREVEERRRAETALRDLNDTLEQRVRAAVAERERAEEALRQAQKMEAVGQLTGGIAHDFNNLLTVVTGNIDMAARALSASGADDARARRALDNALKGAERAAALTQRLLAFSRRQPLAPRALDVDKLAMGMSDLLNRALGETVKLEIVTSPGLWRVEADPNQLEAAILNLAVNARDAMPKGGNLIVETANARLDEEYCAAHAEVAPGQYVVIAVTDSGDGMAKETIARVFEPFFTTKEVGKGTGLGLSMVYGFVKQSGGHVKIYSEEGQGTTVKIYLPRLMSNVLPEEEAVLVPGLEVSASAETLLVVEDDDDVRAYTVECLRELGYRVLEAHDGPSALRLLERQDGPVDLLFTDVVMPGMSGRELSDAAREVQPGLRVLYTSGYTRNAIVHGGRLDPGVEMIAKPFTYAALAQKVRDVLDTGRTGRVLVVEDEATVRALAVEALAAAGYACDEAANAVEALGKVRSAQGRYDAVLIDHGLPDRSGDGLAIELRAMHSDLPVLLTSGEHEAVLRERFAADRCIAVIGKPYTGAKLSEALRLVGVRCARAG